MPESDDVKHAIAERRITKLEGSLEKITDNQAQHKADLAAHASRLQSVETFVNTTKSNVVKATWTIVLSFVATISYFAIAVMEKIGLVE